MKGEFNMFLPKTISQKYHLYKTEKVLGQSSSKKGIYVDKKTHAFVFVKVNHKNKPLLREFTNQQLFYEQSKLLKANDIIIAKPLKIIKENNYAALAMEYLKADSIHEADIQTRLDIYMKVLIFLEKINTTTNVNRKNYLPQKSATWQLTTLIYFLLKNLMLYPSKTSLFIRSLIFIMRVSPHWRKLTTNWTCHGDINVSNLLTHGKKVFVVDFAETYISHRFFDISRALNSTWYQAEFHKQLWNHIVKVFRFTSKQQEILKSFVVFNLMQRLSMRYKNTKQEQFYLKRLELLLK